MRKWSSIKYMMHKHDAEIYGDYRAADEQLKNVEVKLINNFSFQLSTAKAESPWHQIHQTVLLIKTTFRESQGLWILTVHAGASLINKEEEEEEEEDEVFVRFPNDFGLIFEHRHNKCFNIFHNFPASVEKARLFRSSSLLSCAIIFFVVRLCTLRFVEKGKI